MEALEDNIIELIKKKNINYENVLNTHELYEEIETDIFNIVESIYQKMEDESND